MKIKANITFPILFELQAFDIPTYFLENPKKIACKNLLTYIQGHPNLDFMNLNYPLLLDGGLSNVLEQMGCDLSHHLWSANLVEANPEAIIEAHLSYLNAGAQCIITSSYQASIPGLRASGHDKKKAEKLILKTIDLAEKAIERLFGSGYSGARPLVAASIGPYGAYLADGSEYGGNYGISDEALEAFHRPRIELLNKSTADLLACETIPNFQEARVVANILESMQKPAWVCVSCKDGGHLNDGTPIEQCAKLFSQHPTVFAFGVNCTDPKYISSLVSRINSVGSKKRTIVYPNSGEVYDAQSKTWQKHSNKQVYSQMALEWLALGVDIIGGCCQIGPSQIEDLNKKLLLGSRAI